MDITTGIARVIHPEVTGRKVPSGTESGNPLPGTGKELPPPPPERTAVQAVARVQQFLADNRRSLQFRIDERSGRTVISVINPETNEIIRQIPPEELLRIAARIDAGQLRLISARG